MQGRFANIIVDISHEKVDRPFQYRIPEALLGLPEPGMKVRIPFGSGNKLRTGYIIEITDEPEFDVSRLKEIDSVIEEGVQVESRLIRLAFWMKEHYGSTMINALKTVLPVRQKLKQQEKKEICLRVGKEEARAEMLQCERKHQGAKARVLRELIAEERLPQTLVARKLNISPATFRSLQEAGLIAINSVPYYRNPVKLDAQREAGHRLSERQQFVVDSVLKDYDDGIRQTYLLRGITGSGKTEVYMELIAQMIQRGRQAVMLIPEIALTYQTVLRFYKRFGDRVSVMNSTLSPGEKYDQCERARKGEIDVIIGPRSALFTPFPDIGIIIIDEEHENSYKSETMPKYHARETAEELAALHGASVFLGSATPSLESFYRAKQGKYRLFTLNERLTGGVLPTVYVEDLRQELKNGNRSIFSKRLQELLEDRLGRGEQSMLFLNRRGYAGFVSCRMCGHVMKCPHCDVSLSEHRNGTLVCHYCGFTQPAVKLCPECGSKYILGFRAGTEQIEEQLHKLYPDKKVLRMDADTISAAHPHEELLSRFQKQRVPILVGTQMVAKGLDFEDVTLVGVLGIDSLLFAQGFRAYETVFSLITQVVGRSGRAKDPGFAIIQTTDPDNPVLNLAAAQDYDAFFEQEIAYRRLGLYPPFCGLCVIGFAGGKEIEVARAAARFSALLGQQAARQPDLPLRVLGPTPGNIEKINDTYRYKLTIKCRNDRRFRDLVRETLGLYEQEKLPSKASVVVDLHSDGDI